MRAFAGMTTKREKAGRHPENPFAMFAEFLTSAPVVIYGQEVLYAARGQEARSRPAKAGIQ